VHVLCSLAVSWVIRPYKNVLVHAVIDTSLMKLMIVKILAIAALSLFVVLFAIFAMTIYVLVIDTRILTFNQLNVIHLFAYDL